MDRIGRIIQHLAILNRSNSNQRLKAYKITRNEATVLMYLKSNQEVYQEDIIKELQIDKSAVTRLLQNMESKGLIKRVPLASDKRFYLIEMTDKGNEKQSLVDQTFEQNDIDLVKGLSEEELLELRRMLNIIEHNLKEVKISE